MRALAAAGVGGLAGCADGGTGTTEQSTAAGTTTATATDTATETGTAAETDTATETENSEADAAGPLGEPTRETENAVIYRDVEFAATEDGPLALDYYEPTGVDGPVPLVVHVHGGGWALGSKGGGEYADVPVQEGAAFASVQYRLSDVASFPHPVRDVVAGMAWCREHADEIGVDPERVALTGESAGGHLASLVATAPEVDRLRPDGVPAAAAAVSCVVSVSGVYDFTEGPVGESGLARQFLGCEDDACDDRQAAGSPVTYVDGDDPPALLYHGTADGVVPYSQGERFVDAAEDAGMPVRFVTGEGGGHVDPYAGEWGERYERIQREFLQEHLF